KPRKKRRLTDRPSCESKTPDTPFRPPSFQFWWGDYPSDQVLFRLAGLNPLGVGTSFITFFQDHCNKKNSQNWGIWEFFLVCNEYAIFPISLPFSRRFLTSSISGLLILYFLETLGRLGRYRRRSGPQPGHVLALQHIERLLKRLLRLRILPP